MALLAECLGIKSGSRFANLIAQGSELQVVDLVSFEKEAIAARLEFKMAAGRCAQSFQYRGRKGNLPFACDFD